MNRWGLAPAVLALCVANVCAQQQTVPVTASTPVATDSPQPKPGQDGAYFVGPSVTAPQLVKVMAAGYPTYVSKKVDLKLTVLTLIVGADGKAAAIEVIRSSGEAFDASAINAVQLSRFAPGGLNGKPVPVRIDVEVPFRSSGVEAVPRVVIAERDLPLPAPAAAGKKPPSYTPPIPIHVAQAAFPDPDVKHSYPAVALVTVLVTKDGLPSEVRVARGLGFGMDEQAVAAVKKYRFLPATQNGKVVAERRNVEVKFPLS
jgi:TonB family protein